MGDLDVWQEQMHRTVEEKVRWITENRERLCEAWVAETGLLPSESELVEVHEPDGTTRVFVRRRL